MFDQVLQDAIQTLARKEEQLAAALKALREIASCDTPVKAVAVDALGLIVDLETLAPFVAASISTAGIGRKQERA